ncbi:vesicle-associated membrane protein, putative [Entamoeba dispar SAW760]|uniref:Vesicle-associated membrane protein, putative n=1 Tax=Entamoeba dispar (strain ATCC PRA-260 / SAW760) TaxID=370354 RepID=B0EG42_ENTDS|nr:vesicle-associated membrane protein, putative [Entamoeba dispar SAW760]EDR26509.1 vesicle-associated membrane protein, putative [Entamoeba dispar SAW760]|eukprot:EDR26509.1 vesicle-associated membrane protein, putative [Entamoeba dispar SAW760]
MASPLKRYDPGPQILYCCVAFKTNILAEYYEVSLPGADKIIKQILAKASIGKNILHHELLSFCLLTTDIITVITITGESFPQERAFDFIDEVVINFSKLFNTDQLATLPTRSLNNTFAPMMKQKINHFNDLTNDPLNKIQQTLDQTVTRVNENVDKLLSRGKVLDSLDGESDLIMRDTEELYKQSIELKRKFKNKNIRLYIIVGMIVFLIIFIGIWSYCGIRFQRCHK